jgi:phosphohistidine phosphatase
MKRLITVRHGKSSWAHDVRDHDRPLNQRGIDDGHLIGKAFKKTSYRPDLIWSSTAARALQTATLVCEYIDYELEKLKLKRALYTFSDRDQLGVVRSCDDEVETLMIFSHNDGLTELANAHGSERFNNVPTTGLVIMEFDVDRWQNIDKGETVTHIFPKHFKS